MKARVRSELPQAMRKPTGALLAAVALALLLVQTGGRAAPGDSANALPYSRGFLLTGNYVVGGVDFTSGQNPVDQNGLATGTIKFNDTLGNKVPDDAEIVAADCTSKLFIRKASILWRASNSATR